MKASISTTLRNLAAAAAIAAAGAGAAHAATPAGQPSVDNVHGGHIATQAWVCCEVMCDAAGPRANFEHAKRLRATGKAEQALNLHRLQVARRKIKHNMRLTLK